MADNTDIDNIRQSFETIRDERVKHANTARRIGDAFLSLLDFCTRSSADEYLSRKHDDAAEGMITFL